MLENHYYQTKSCTECGKPVRSFSPKRFDYEQPCGNCGEYIPFNCIEGVYGYEGKMTISQAVFDYKYSDGAKKCK